MFYDKVKKFIEESKDGNLKTAFKKLSTRHSIEELGAIAWDNVKYRATVEAIIGEMDGGKYGKGATKNTIYSQRSHLKKVRQVLRDHSEEAFSEAVEGGLKGKMPSMKKLRQMPFYELIETLGMALDPKWFNEKTQRFNYSGFLTYLGYTRIEVTGFYVSLHQNGYPTRTIGLRFSEKLSKHPILSSSIPKSMILDKCDFPTLSESFTSADLKYERYGFNYTNVDEDVAENTKKNMKKLKQQIDNYIEYRLNGTLPKGATKWSLYTSNVDHLRVVRKWKKGTTSDERSRKEYNIYFGYLETSNKASKKDMDISMLLNWNYLESFYEHRLSDKFGDYVTMRFLSEVKSLAYTDSYMWCYHPMLKPVFIKGKEFKVNDWDSVTYYSEFLIKNTSHLIQKLRDNLKEKKNNNSHSIQSGRKNAPWFFSKNTTYKEGWRLLDNLINLLEKKFDLADEKIKTKKNVLSKLTIATWLSMEKEVPLRVSNSNEIIVLDEKPNHKMLERLYENRTPCVFKNGKLWELYCPKSALKNSKSSKITDIEDVLYTTKTSALITKLVNTKNNNGNKLFSVKWIDHLLNDTSVRALKEMFPNEEYPPMNPHVMRHIVATYYINVKEYSINMVAALLMDDPNTVMNVYTENSYTKNWHKIMVERGLKKT